MRRIISVLAALAPAILCAEVDYLRDVKPLLEHKCFACHGALKQNGGLRLDTAEFIRKGGKNGSALELILGRVTTDDESKRMPQESSALTTDEIAILRSWIEAGAPAPEGEIAMADPRQHWSYQTPQRPPLPEGKAENPIDRFIAARRAANGIHEHAPPADNALLLRRVYLDLIGIPPTPEQVEKAGNYEEVVQQLLDSPMYGERWGRHWMDVWRYADWYGRRQQNEIRYSVRHIWRWRDWIVESLNDDKGYDRMLLEMLAGDELAPTDRGALAATGYLGRNWYVFNRNVWMFDTVETTSQALLGLTMRCARCHDHKYDPISQEDYYRFRAFFEPHDVRTDALEFLPEMVKDNNTKMVPIDGLSRVFDRDAETPTYRFIRGDDRRPDETKILAPGVPESLGGEIEIKPVDLPAEAFYPALRPEIVASRVAKAEEAERDAKAAVKAAKNALAQAEAKLKAGAEKGEAKLIWTDDFSEASDVWKPVGGIWKFEDGVLREEQVANFATILRDEIMPRDFRLRVRYRTLEPGTVRSVGVSFDYVDQVHSQDVYTSTRDAKQSVQAFHRLEKNVYPRPGIVPVELKVGAETTLEIEARGQTLKIWLNGEQRHDYVMPIPRREGKLALWVHAGSAEFLQIEATALPVTRETLLDDVRTMRVRLVEAETKAQAAEVEVASIEARAAAERAKYTKPQPENLAAVIRNAAKADAVLKFHEAEFEVARSRDRLERVEAAHARFAAKASVDPLADAKAAAVKADQQLQEATKAVESPGEAYEPLGEMHPDTSTGRRLALAHWIVAPQNPRTARVAVNHMWMRHFGEPLVASVSNFGPSGKEPTHPDLLDWLAIELIESGWSMKHLHELMVTSQTYQMASSGDAPDADPENRYFWRMNPRRMEAEAVRDSILAICGELDPEMGGPDIDPAQGSSSKRRSLYFRTTPDQQELVLSLFDAANPNACYRREESITPQQALALTNSGLALDQSRLFAAELSGVADFANVAFERILGRAPSDLELSAMNRFLAKSAQQLPDGGALPGKGDSTVKPSTDPSQRARENLIHVLFSHNDFVTIR